MRLRALGLLHPFPSAANAVVVVVLALLAGGSPGVAALLGGAMLALQFSIGASNDVVDRGADAIAKPTKPIPSGLITGSAASAIAVVSAGVGALLASSVGPASLMIAAAMYGCGQLYNFVLKRGPWGWVPYALALPLIPLFAWHGATGMAPPHYEVMFVVAVLLGAALSLANATIDRERDRSIGIGSVAITLGVRRTPLTMSLLYGAAFTVAWWTLDVPRPGVGPPVLASVGLATALVAVGVLQSAAASARLRQIGWALQVAGVAALAAGWVAGILSLPPGAN
ncbi:hypothetical protein BH20CHL6_BH20CHL6_07920 [soil metagenome]